MHIGFFQWLLQFAHPHADHRTGSGTGCINKIGDPNFARQLRRVERLPLLVYELEMGNRAVG